MWNLVTGLAVPHILHLKIKAVHSFRISGTTNAAMQHQITEDQNPCDLSFWNKVDYTWQDFKINEDLYQNLKLT